MKQLLLYIAVLLAAGALAYGAWLATRYYDAYLALSYLAAARGESRLERSTAPPTRASIEYTIEGRPSNADLYLPGKDAPQAGIVLVPGAVVEGKDDKRLVSLAEALARMGFAVLTPDLKGYHTLEVRTEQITEVADAFRYLVQREELSPGGRAGFAAFSLAAGPAILASLEKDLRDRVRFIFAVGAYHDMRRTVRYFTTGHFELDGQPQYREPSDYALVVFARTMLGHLSDPNDRATIDAMIDTKVESFDADISGLASRLGPEGRSLYRVLTNSDPDVALELIDALPRESIALIDALSLVDKDLRQLEARFILVHGKSDPLIPYSESIALGRAVAPSHARVFIIEELLEHVELKFSHVLTARFWREELPDAKRVFDAVTALLDEREAGK
jgi:pimeloyl-ACP methyl ester carboxylesterase